MTWEKFSTKKGVGGNKFHTNSIFGVFEQLNNKMLSVMKNMTTINRNEDVLPKDKEREDLWLIDEGAEVG